MVKRNGETVEYQVALNIPHLRKKINKTCANRPVSCVNDKKTMKNAGFCFSGQYQRTLLLYHHIIGEKRW